MLIAFDHLPSFGIEHGGLTLLRISLIYRILLFVDDEESVFFRLFVGFVSYDEIQRGVLSDLKVEDILLSAVHWSFFSFGFTNSTSKHFLPR